MTVAGLLVGLAVGAGVRVADVRGLRWLAATSGCVFFVLAVVGFARGLSPATAAAMVGVIVGYLATMIASSDRFRWSRSH